MIVPQRYKMKDSGVEWIGEIPEHWEVKRLKYVAEMLVSNVDKHIKPLEESVRLCNYVDVYKNDYITNEIAFMTATASKEEINRFKIKNGDVIITKDSEDWLDIGVPSLVAYEEENLICGYHLAILRPNHRVYDNFLFMTLLAQYFRTQFSVKANGVTRYGISYGAIQTTWLTFPSVPEQISIAKFLGKKVAQIKKAVELKQQQIDLLKERKQIIIQNAVTKGINPDVKMKDSCVPWIGELPEHWEVKRAKYLFKEVDERSIDGTEELLSVSHVTGVTPRSEKKISMFLAEDYSGSKLCNKGDLVFNIMWAWMGALGVSNRKGIVSPSYGVYRKIDQNSFNSVYLEELLKSTNYIEYYNKVSTGLHSSRLRFYSHMFFYMKLGFPLIEEQDVIVAHIEVESTKIDKAINLLQQQIEKIKEYKTILINNAVTGKIRISQ